MKIIQLNRRKEEGVLKKYFNAAIFLGFFFVFCGGLTANAYMIEETIPDEYIGGNPNYTSYYGEDVIGQEDWFGVDQMTVYIDPGSEMVVVISSSYFDNIGLYGTELGDLFISTDGYNPYDPTEDDCATNGEDWEYVVVLDDHTPEVTGGTASGDTRIYATDQGAIENSSAPSGYVYRADQEVQFNPYYDETSIDTGDWEIDDSTLTMTIPWVDDWDDVEEFGFHWTMTCGNDVIEGKVSVASVPEPASMLLLGSGLFGLALIRKRKFMG